MYIEIYGFQIIKHAVLEPVGLTLLVGNTNNGKSSICRAINSALFGSIGTDFINKSSGYSKVLIKFDQEENRDPVTICWQKNDKGKSVYEINGVDIIKAGKRGPADDLSLYGISTFKVRKEDLNIFYWRQLSEPFIISQTPTYVFDAISSILEDRKVLPVLKKIISDNKSLKDNLLIIDGSIRSFTSLVSTLSEESAKLSILGSLESDFNYIRSNRILLSRLYQLSKDLQEIESNISKADELISKLNINIDYFINFQDLFNDFSTFEILKTKLTSIISIDLSIGELLDEFNSLEEFLNNFNEGISKVDTKLYSSLINSHKAINSIDSTINTTDISISYFSLELEKNQNSLTSLQKEVGVCPICKRPYEV